MIGASGLIYREITADTPDTINAANPPTPLPAAATAPALRAQDPGWAALALARPLFASTRRPASHALATTAPPALPPLLKGTIVSRTQGKLAFLLSPQADRTLMLHEGDRIGLYTIVRITVGEVLADGPDGPLALRIGAARPIPRDIEPTFAQVDPHRPIGSGDQDE